MTNLVVTGALSLRLLMPAFNHVAERAHLDVQLPLGEGRVTKFYIGKGSPSLMATIDSHHQFNWHSTERDFYKGRIYYRDTEFNGSIGPSGFRQLTNQVSIISTNEAKAIAERCLKDLGFDLKKIKASEPVVGQFTYQEKPGDIPMPVPLFGIRWFPKRVKNPEWHDRLVEIQVSGLTRKIVYLSASPAADTAVAIDLRQFMTNRTEMPHESQPKSKLD